MKIALSLLFAVLPFAGEASVQRINLVILDQNGTLVVGSDVVVDRGTLWGAISQTPEHDILISRWEVELEPGQTKVNVRVTKSTEFLVGEYSGPAQDTITIHMKPDTSAGANGRVEDVNGRAIGGVTVTVDGFDGHAVTNAQGRFTIDLKTAENSPIMINAEKAGCESARQLHIAGAFPATIRLECK